jgi:hypothetical protein
MEKSAAYLLGFQAGFGEGLSLEKTAQLIELLDFVPANEKQAAALIQAWRARIGPLFRKLLGRGKKPAVQAIGRGADVPTSLRVAFEGGPTKVVGAGIKTTARKPLGEGSFGTEQRAPGAQLYGKKPKP